MLTVQTAKRMEVWSNLQCAGGVRQGFLLDVISCVASVKTNGDDKLTFSMPLASAGAALIVEDSIVRVWQDDATWDEWVIWTATRDTGAGTLVVECDTVATLLGRRGLLVGQTDTIGVTRYDIEFVGLTPTQIVDTFVLTTLSTGGLTWVARGTVDPATPIDLTLSWESPLAVLTRILALAACELQIRRNGTAGYFIDLLTKIGAGAATADIRVRKNLLSLKQERSVIDYTTRVFPRGAASDTDHATMGRAVWNVASVVGGVIGLADPVGGAGPILYDGQLVGAKIRKGDGTLTAAITASSAGAQTVTVPSAAGITVGDLVQVRRSDGTELTYLETVDGGKSVGLLDNPDTPPANNLIPNPAARQYSNPAIAADGWGAVGGVAIAKNVAAPFTRVGGASMHIVATVAGQGVQSPTAKVFPSALEPYGSGFAMLWMVSGQVRVELVVTKADTTQVILPVAPNVASSTTLGQWENLGVSGENLNALTAISVAVRITSIGAAEFYVDAVQVTESASQQEFVEGSGGTQLWQLANDRLRTNGGPSLVYDVPFVDLARLDGTTYPAELITLGGNVRVTDDRIPVALTTRIIALERDHLIPGNSKVTLSTLADDLEGTLARPTRPPRLNPVFTGTGLSSDPGSTGPIAAPALTLSWETEDQIFMPTAVLLVAFTPPAVAGFAGLLIAVRANDSTTNTFANQAPVTESPIRVPARFGTTYNVQAWAVNKAGVKSATPSTATIVIPANHRIGRGIIFTDPVTHTDDGFVLHSSTNDGRNAGATVNESGGRRINRLLAKALAADVDTLDGLPEGSTFKRVHNTAIDGSGFPDFSKSGFSNKNTDNVADGIATVRTPQYAGGDNLAENGNFEGSAANIPVPGYVSNGFATISLTTVAPYQGLKSLQVDNTAQFGAAQSVRRWKATAGDVFFVSAAMKANTASDNADCQLMFIDASGGYLGGVQPQTSSTSWVVLSSTGTAPANTAYVQLTLQNNRAGAGRVFFDDVKVYRVHDASQTLMRGSGDTTPVGTIVGNITNAGHAGSGMQESGGKAINRLFAKPLLSDPDTADTIANGASRRVTTNNEASGGGRGFVALDTSNQLLNTGLARGRNYMVGRLPAIIVAKTFGIGTPYGIGQRLASLGYSVTYNDGASVATCQQYDIVLIDANNVTANAANTLIQQLIDAGCNVIVSGNDSGQSGGLFYITSTLIPGGGASNGVINVSGNPHPLLDYLPSGSIGNDGDTGVRISGAVPYAKLITFYADGNAEGLLMQFPTGAIVYHGQSLSNVASSGSADQFLMNLAEYLGGGMTRSYKGSHAANVHLDQSGVKAGSVKRARSFDDGSFAVVSSSTDGLNCNVSVNESGGRRINRLFAKPLSADPDTLDANIDGVNYKRVRRVISSSSTSPAQFLYQSVNGISTSTSDVSIGSYTLPAGTLNVNGDTLRVTVVAQIASGADSFTIKFGGTTLFSGSLTAGLFLLTLYITRTGSATQRVNAVNIPPSGQPNLGAVTTAAETLSNALTIDFRAQCTSGGQVTYVSTLIEFLGV